jgi:hypothetical protein
MHTNSDDRKHAKAMPLIESDKQTQPYQYFTEDNNNRSKIEARSNEPS